VAAGLLLFFACKSPGDSPELTDAILPVSFTQVHLTDSFWLPRMEVNRTVSIPSAFHQCEINGRFDNFALAAGLIQGEHRGDYPFDDTDPYKIIEGASYSLAVTYDALLDAYLDSVITLIAAAQEPNGYLTTCVTNRAERLAGWWGKEPWEKLNSHELYNSGHLYEAAVAHYQATGKRSLLDVAIRNADLVCRVFGPEEGQKHVPSGHPIIEMALAKLYQVTGDEKYLQEARYFVEETGRGTDGHRLSAYSQDHKPILEQDEILGHAVRAGYLYSGVVDVATLMHDTAYFRAVERIWNNMANKKLYITGGIGSRSQGEGFGPEYELHNHNAYCETCASIANVYWNQRMFLATGDARYADLLERALYNGVISGVSLGGDRFFYDNPLASDGHEERQEWFGCACCPGNITRFMASVPKYMYATRERSLYVNLYASGHSEMEVGGVPLELIQDTQYPWDGQVRFTVNPSSAATFTLRLRIPGWATDTPVAGSDLYTFASGLKTSLTVSVNGEEMRPPVGNGYLLLDRAWEPGDEVLLSLPMEPRYIRAHDRVAADEGLHALQRGPIVYCLEGIDQQDHQVFNKYLSEDVTPLYAFEPLKLNGIVELFASGGEVSRDLDGELLEREALLSAVPYAVWNNRGKGEMTVWIPGSAAAARPVPKETIASRAAVYVLGEGRDEQVFAVTDHWEPKHSGDLSRPYLSLWRGREEERIIEYRFEQAEMLRGMEVYFVEFDHYDGDYRLPLAWKLQYLDGGVWTDAEASAYECEKDRYNVVDFSPPLLTTALRMSVRLVEGASGGIHECKFY
jgi:DUF1680 family protein